MFELFCREHQSTKGPYNIIHTLLLFHSFREAISTKDFKRWLLVILSKLRLLLCRNRPLLDHYCLTMAMCCRHQRQRLRRLQRPRCQKIQSCVFSAGPQCRTQKDAKPSSVAMRSTAYASKSGGFAPIRASLTVPSGALLVWYNNHPFQKTSGCL